MKAKVTIVVELDNVPNDEELKETCKALAKGSMLSVSNVYSPKLTGLTGEYSHTINVPVEEVDDA